MNLFSINLLNKRFIFSKVTASKVKFQKTKGGILKKWKQQKGKYHNVCVVINANRIAKQRIETIEIFHTCCGIYLSISSTYLISSKKIAAGKTLRKIFFNF